MSRCLLLGVLVVLVSAAETAQAAPAIQYGLQDDAWLAAGPGPNALPERIALLKTLGVKVVRYNLLWDKTAPQSPSDPTDPSDPAYHWEFSDPVVNALHEAGIAVLLTIYGTPSWANGDQPPAYAPTSAAAIAGFATAAARRYPWVKKWAIWNEPNEIRWLRPVSPSIYTARLLNPAYTALHQAITGVQVGAGVTAPRGNAGGLSPIAWITGLHAAHARFDAYAHNPYPSSPFETPFSGACKYCTTVTMASMPRLISSLDKYFGNKPIWLTEYGYQTNPPDRTDGVSLATQARYVSEAGLRAYQLPQVTLLIQYLYRDEPDLAGWQSGFQTDAGSHKPAFNAFRLPLAEVSRTGTETTIWGQIRPRSGRQPYTIQQLNHGHWHTVGSSHLTSPGGFLTQTLTASKGGRLRIWSPRDNAISPTLTIA